MNHSIATANNLPMADSLLMRLVTRTNHFNEAALHSLGDSDTTNETVEDKVLRSGLMDERHVVLAYANHYLLPIFDPPIDAPLPVHPSAAESLSYEFCRNHNVAPLSEDGHTLEIAIFSPDGLRLADEVRLLTGRQMRPLFAPRSVIHRLIELLYPSEHAQTLETETRLQSDRLANWEAGFQEMQTARSTDWESATNIPVNVTEASPKQNAKAYVQEMFQQAVQREASELHLEPYKHDCRIRIRVRGTLQRLKPPARAEFEAVVRRIKTLSKMKTSASNLPQEGVIRLTAGGQQEVIRVTTCPTLHGEKVMMRFGSGMCKLPKLEHLGLDPHQSSELKQVIEQQQGLILVAGPTASGRSTTLYACLKECNTNASNIHTVERKVAFPVQGLNQVQTSTHPGLSLSAAIESCLHQDPDVLMAGELENHATAKACVMAAASGRMVLTALQTSDGLDAITCMRDLGIHSHALAKTLRLVVAQKLLPRLCNHCKVPSQLDARTAAFHKIGPRSAVLEPKGCDRCDQTGFRGHLAVFEVLRINRDLAEMIRRGESVKAMKSAAIAAGTSLMKTNAMRLVAEGQTSLDAVCRGLSCRCQTR